LEQLRLPPVSQVTGLQVPASDLAVHRLEELPCHSHHFLPLKRYLDGLKQSPCLQ
jgi:hypothetical protein